MQSVIYSINHERKTKYLYRPLAQMIGLDILIILFFSFNKQLNQLILLALFVFVISFVFYIGPLLLLFFTYYKENKDVTLLISNDSSRDNSSSNEDSIIELDHSNILKIEKHLSHPSYDERMHWFFWDKFFYYKIRFEDSTELYVTCLLCDSLEVHFQNVPFKKIKRWFPAVF